MSIDPDRARELEERDPLSTLRDEFLIPKGWAYLAGNSLGLQPRAAQAAIQDELDEWARLGVEGWFEAREPWLEYAGALRGSVAPLVGAAPDEVAVMNTLTVNLHLLLASFYRPTAERFLILIEDTAFPSDRTRCRPGRHGTASTWPTRSCGCRSTAWGRRSSGSAARWRSCCCPASTT